MLRLEGVKVRFHGAVALDGIDLEVGPGEVVALIGSNGAGKTTTLNAISRVVSLAGGHIAFADAPLDRASARDVVRAGIVHVPEGRRIFPDLTVRENLLMGATVRPHGEWPQSLERVNALFPMLQAYAMRMAGSLSGGEQQMLALGRALMARPKLLMLDEPSLGLSPVMVERVAELVVKLRGEELSVLLVEQNASLALALSDRAYLLERGKVVLSGSSAALRQDASVRATYLGVGKSQA